jgi:hypothetical protein
VEESAREVLYLVKIKNHSFPCVLAGSGAIRFISEELSLCTTVEACGFCSGVLTSVRRLFAFFRVNE